MEKEEEINMDVGLFNEAIVACIAAVIIFPDGEIQRIADDAKDHKTNPCDNPDCSLGSDEIINLVQIMATLQNSVYEHIKKYGSFTEERIGDQTNQWDEFLQRNQL